MFGADHYWLLHPSQEGFSSSFWDLESNRLLCFVLNDLSAFFDMVGCVDICNHQFDQIKDAAYGVVAFGSFDHD